jgi:hypothetical protein
MEISPANSQIFSLKPKTPKSRAVIISKKVFQTEYDRDEYCCIFQRPSFSGLWIGCNNIDIEDGCYLTVILFILPNKNSCLHQ